MERDLVPKAAIASYIQELGLPVPDGVNMAIISGGRNRTPEFSVVVKACFPSGEHAGYRMFAVCHRDDDGSICFRKELTIVTIGD